ncbi:MAG: hypothetical protein AVDCRST_MAG68-3290, partial [uncultured Gemmatimonadetes bacterium]
PFLASIPVATTTARASAGTLWSFTLIGLYVGILPVLLGMLWLPALERVGPGTLMFVTAATVGLLLYLGLDATAEALEMAGTLSATYQGVGLVGIGVAGTWLLLDAISRGQRSVGQSEASQRRSRATVIAVGIGLHNLGEGLAIGAAYAVGAAALGTVRGGTTEAPVDAATIRWTAPAELATLPTDRIRLTAVPFAGTGAATLLAASSAQGGLLALRPLGRGRAASLAITDSWRWRMEGGRVEEHREFWRGLVDWLASAPRAPVSLRPAESVGTVGTRQEVAVFAEGSPPPYVLLGRPSGPADTLRLTAARPGTLLASFVPAEEGVYTLAVPNFAARAGFRATRGVVDAGWARLALIASSSGGGLLPPDELAREVAARAGPDDAPPWPLAWLLFAALVAAAGTEWAIRRLTGRV